MNAIYGQVVQEVEVVAEVAEISGEQDFRHGAVQLVISGLDRVTPILIQGSNQRGFIHLHPFCPRLRQFVQQLLIDGQQAFEQVEAVRIILALAEPEVSDGADDNGFDAFHAERLRFLNLIKQTLRVEFELGVLVEFGNDVVIVAVKPLGHLASGHASALVDGTATTRGTEKRIQLVATAFISAFRQIAEGDAHIEDVVIQREIADRHMVKTGLILPVARAQGFRHLLQLGGGAFAFPVGFEGKFQFAFGADARETKVVDGCHTFSESFG